MFNPNTPSNVPEEFEKLRSMDSFSDEMFNRIVAFQEKLHAAWDLSAPFEKRIKELPLHSFVFSNPDRDPATTSHTVSPFYPISSELNKIAGYIKQLSDHPVVCDMHTGNGFIGSLLGNKGLQVIGIREPGTKPNQITDFYDEKVFDLKSMRVEEIDFSYDVAFSSWMPSEKNYTPLYLKHRPKLIIFIHTRHIDKSTEKYQTGTENSYDMPDSGYKLIDEWSVKCPENLFHYIWPDLTPNIEEVRHVKIYADKPFHQIEHKASQVLADRYDWEAELDMAETARLAKEMLHTRGFPV